MIVHEDSGRVTELMRQTKGSIDKSKIRRLRVNVGHLTVIICHNSKTRAGCEALHMITSSLWLNLTYRIPFNCVDFHSPLPNPSQSTCRLTHKLLVIDYSKMIFSCNVIGKSQLAQK